MKFIGVIQILGGTLGLCAILSTMLTIGNMGLLVAVPFFSLSIFAGYALIMDLPFGKALSIFNQILQVVKISGFGVVSYYYAGLALYLKTDSHSFGYQTQLGGGAIFALNNSNYWELGINVLALVLLAVLIMQKKNDR